MAVSHGEAGETPGRQTDRQTDRQTPRPRAAWGSPPALPLQPWALCPVYKGKGSSVFVFLGLSNAFLAPLVSRQGRGCLDGKAQIYLSWKLAGNGAEPPPNWLRDDPTLELVLVGFAQRKLFLMAPLAAPGLGLGNTDTSRTEHAPWAKRSA